MKYLQYFIRYYRLLNTITKIHFSYSRSSRSVCHNVFLRLPKFIKGHLNPKFSIVTGVMDGNDKRWQRQLIQSNWKLAEMNLQYFKSSIMAPFVAMLLPEDISQWTRKENIGTHGLAQRVLLGKKRVLMREMKLVHKQSLIDWYSTCDHSRTRVDETRFINWEHNVNCLGNFLGI